MALSARLNLRQGQSLVITPKLQQAIKLLQLSNVELSEFVKHMLQNNPLLELENTGGYKCSTDTFQDSRSEATNKIRLKENPNINTEPEGFMKADIFNLNGITENYGAKLNSGELIEKTSSQSSVDALLAKENSLFQRQGDSAYDFDSQKPQRIDAQSDVISLRDHLLKQANIDLADPIDRMIAAYMVDSLDHSGYLTVSLENISKTLGYPQSRVKNILKVIQDFDPPGIFARNLSECLGLQLKDLGRYDPAMQKFIKNLDLLVKKKFNLLKKICGVNTKDLVEMIKEIKKLNPKPALNFEPTFIQTLAPDVLARQGKNGSWFIDLNTETLPHVLVNQRYYMEIKSQALREKDKTYISECYQSANWLVKALHQRAQTIVKVATEIVRHQEGFLEKGIQFLRPLVLREIAETLNIHESTVSRVTQNKYISTPRGTFELKYFFSSAVRATSGGHSASAKSVRFQINHLILNEMPNNVLSDEKIVKILRDDGINIARRTVAKYRESMDIPSSVQRRREKAPYL